MKVAIAGIKGSYADLASAKLASECMVLEAESFGAACGLVADGLAEFAVLPLHNKITGDIGSALSALERHGLRKLDEARIDVNHVLAALPGSSLGAVCEVVSHPEALKQCDKFIKRNRQFGVRTARDTATAVRNVVAGNDHRVAAITGRRAAETYGAHVICEGIADEKDNWTLFGLFARKIV